jgi:hypothetical protein
MTKVPAVLVLDSFQQSNPSLNLFPMACITYSYVSPTRVKLAQLFANHNIIEESD